MNKSAFAYYKQMTVLLSVLGFVVILIFVVAQNMEIQHYNELYEDIRRGMIAFQAGKNNAIEGTYIPPGGGPAKRSNSMAGGIAGGFGLGTYITTLPSPGPSRRPSSNGPSTCRV